MNVLRLLLYEIYNEKQTLLFQKESDSKDNVILINSQSQVDMVDM